MGVEDKAVTNGTYNPSFTMALANSNGSQVITLFTKDSATFQQESDHDDGVAGASTSDAFSYNVNVVAGQFLIDEYEWVNSPTITITSKTDSLGNSWLCDAPLSFGSSSAQDCHSFATFSGADTVTTNFSSTGASFIGMAHAAFTGYTAIDKNQTAIGVSSTPSSGNVTTVHAQLLDR